MTPFPTSLRLLCPLILFPALAFSLTPSAVSLTASPTSANYGQPVTLTATVTAGATGNVTFYDGVTMLGIGTLSGGQANLSTVMLPSGTRSLRAYYGGDTTYAASSSALVPETVTAGTSLGLRRPILTATTAVLNFIAVGDFNRDGKQDIVTNGTNGTTGVSIFLGKGDGSFQAGVNYPTLGQVSGIAIGDFNADGKMDLAVVNRGYSTVSVLLGNGDGTFQAAVNSTAGSNVYAVAVGDFNADGRADLVVANTSTNSIGVLLGKGDGTFSAPVNYATGSNPEAVAVGDFNADGNADIAVAFSTGVSVLVGNGTGGFGPSVNYATGTSTNYNYSVVVADVNNDGKADLAVGGYYGLFVLLGHGDGTFGAAVNFTTVPAYTVVAADFDGDGNSDLAFASSTFYPAVGVLLGNGDGTFKATSYTASPDSYALAAGDFNLDGKTDLVAGNGSTSGFKTLLGGAIPDLSITATHFGIFSQGQVAAIYNISVANVGDVATSGAVGVVLSLPSGVTAASLAGNGWTCILATVACSRTDSLAAASSYPITAKVNIAANMTGSATSTFTVSGGGDQNLANNQATDTSAVRLFTATTLTSSPNPATLGHPVALTATVTAGASGAVTFYDGLTFLGSAVLAGGRASITTYQLSSGVRLLRAYYLGDSSFGPSVSGIQSQTVTPVTANGVLPYVSYKVDNFPQWIGSGDFNGDGKTDLVTANSGPNYVGSLSALIGNGDGSFRPAVNYSLGINYPIGGAVGDFNGDGKLDVVVSASNNGLSVLLGKGDGTFRTALTSNPSNSYTSLAVADFDGDGKQDLVALSSGIVVVLLGNGDGTFQSPVSITTSATYYTFVGLADMNADGKPDLVCDGSSGVPSVLLGNGDGTFQTALTGPGIATQSFAIGDFNGDGKPDLALLSPGQISVQLGKGDGTLQTSVTSNQSLNPGYSAIIGDFNGDGKLDILYAGSYSSTVGIIFGNGDGTFQSPAATITTESNSGGAVGGDFNGDGRPDFAVFSPNSSTVDIFLGGQFSGLSISAIHAGNFTAGQTGTYQIIIANPNFAYATGTLTVTDTLPAGLTATAISGNYPWSCTLATLTCTFTTNSGYTTFPPITISVNVSSSLSPSTITNRATVSNAGIINSAGDATVILSPTTTILTVSPSPSALSQTVTLTATVSAGAAGQVLFSDGGAPLGSGTLISGGASFSTRLLAAGLHALTATYVGDAAHAPSASTIKAQTVNASISSGLAAAASPGTSAGPWAIATADFNRDNKTDLVTVNSTANTVTVLLGNGNGTFGAGTDYAVGTKPVAVVTGDFNNDGKTDLAVVNTTSNNVSILLGNGDGTFQTTVNYATGGGPNALAVGDLNGDGKADLAIANGTDGTFTFLLGNGDGTFRVLANTLSFNSISAIAIGDFNHDGKADIGYLANGYYVYILLGNGDGTFQSSYSGSYLGSSAAALAVADMNADGNADLLVADSTGVSVVLGRGDGTFQNPVQYNGGAQASAIVSGDVNGDGKLDAIIVNPTLNTVSVLLGNGDGTLQPAVSYNVGTQPHGIVAGDFNGDGSTDLATANFSSNNVSVLLGVLTPVFSVTSSHTGNFGFQQIAAVYTLRVANVGPGATSGVVTLADTLPAGLTATSIGGAGWTCTLATLTCTRSDALASGASYPAISLVVNVNLFSQTTVTNTVSVTGGGAVGSTGNDPTIVTSPVGIVATQGSGQVALLSNAFSSQLQATVTTAGGAPIAGASVTFTAPSSPASGTFAGVTTATATSNSAGVATAPAFTANATPGSYNVTATTANAGVPATFSLANVVTCPVSASPNAVAISAAGGKLTLNLTGASCGWTATPNVSWLTPAAATGTSATLSVTVAANATGGQRSGTLTVNSQTVTVTQAGNSPGVGPALVSLNPFQGSGLGANLTFVYSDANGFAAIQSAEFIINPRWEANTRPGGCYVKYAPATGLFTLIADDGVTVAGTAAAGSSTNVANSQCTLFGGTSSAGGSGNTLTVVVSLTFQPSFSGQRHIWMQAVDYNNVSTNWLVYGVWFPTQTSVTAGPWYRMYDPNSKSYLYSADQNEYNYLGSQGFVQQGTSGLVMSGAGSVGGISNIAWYRVFVNATNSHFWTSDRNEFLFLVSQQQAYVGEGVAAFMMPYLNALGQISPQVTNTIPFYRAAYQGANLHFWTSDADEYFGRNGKHLPAGYLGEGIASYIFPASGAQFSEAPPVSPEVISVANGASRAQSGVIAPGQVLAIYGRHLSGEVLLNGVPAKVIEARENEIRVQAPGSFGGASEVSLQVGRTKAVKLSVVPADPAIFGTNAFGRGNAQAVNEDGSSNGPENGAARGSVVTLYTTGFANSHLPIEVHIGGQPAEVISTQVSSARAGSIEVQVRVPETVEAAAFQPVVLHVGNLFSQPGVGLAIR